MYTYSDCRRKTAATPQWPRANYSNDSANHASSNLNDLLYDTRKHVRTPNAKLRRLTTMGWSTDSEVNTVGVKTTARLIWFCLCKFIYKINAFYPVSTKEYYCSLKTDLLLITEKVLYLKRRREKMNPISSCTCMNMQKANMQLHTTN